MKITLLLLIIGVGIACAKYIPRDASDIQSLSRVRRWDSDESVPSEEQNNSNNDDNNSDDPDSKEAKLHKKLLEQQEKERIRQEERQRKLEEKRLKEERKEQEKREKEERKRLERLEKEHLRQEKAQRKAEEKLRKAERKRQEDLQKELNELRHDAIHESAEDFLDTEEESSVEAADVWRNHIYVKYGLTYASTRLEKQAAIRKYMQEELGLAPNSTNSERRQAIINLIKTKLSSDPIVRKAIGEQLVSHLTSSDVQKMQIGLVEDIEELDNKTRLLDNINLPWAQQAKVQIEDKRRFLFAMSQFLSDVLHPQNKEVYNGSNSISSAATNTNSPSSDVVSATHPCGNADNSPSTGANNQQATSVDKTGNSPSISDSQTSQIQGNAVAQDGSSINTAGQVSQIIASESSSSLSLSNLGSVNSQQVNPADNVGNPTQAAIDEPSQIQVNLVHQDGSSINTAGQVTQTVGGESLPTQNNVNNNLQATSVDKTGNPIQAAESDPSQSTGNAVIQDASRVDNAGQVTQTLPVQDSVNSQQDVSVTSAGNPTEAGLSEPSQTQSNSISQDASSANNAEQSSQTVVSETSAAQNNAANNQVVASGNLNSLAQTSPTSQNPSASEILPVQSNVANEEMVASDASAISSQTVGSETSQTQGSIISQDSSTTDKADQSNQAAASEISSVQNNVVNDKVSASDVLSTPSQSVGSEVSQTHGSTINQDSTVIDNGSQSNQAVASETSLVQNNVAKEEMVASDASATSSQTAGSETSQTQGSTISQDSSITDNTSQTNQAAASEITSVQNNVVNDKVSVSDALSAPSQTVGSETSQTQGSTINQDSTVTDNGSQSNQVAISDTTSVQDNQQITSVNANSQTGGTDILPGQNQNVASVNTGASGVNDPSQAQANSVSQDVSSIGNLGTQTSGSELAPVQDGTVSQQVASGDNTGTSTQTSENQSQTQSNTMNQDSVSINIESQTTQPALIETSPAQNNIVNQGALGDAEGSSTQTEVSGVAQTVQSQSSASNQDVSFVNAGQTDQTSVSEVSSGINQETASIDNVDTIMTQSTIDNGVVETQAGSGDGPSESINLTGPTNQENIVNNILPNPEISPAEITTSEAVPAENGDVNSGIAQDAITTESSLSPVELQTTSNAYAPQEIVTDNVNILSTDATLLLSADTLEVATTKKFEVIEAENSTSVTTVAPNSGDTVNPTENFTVNQDNTESSTTIAADFGLPHEAQTEATPENIPVVVADMIVEATEAQSIVDATTEVVQETVTDGIIIPVEPGASIVEITQQ